MGMLQGAFDHTKQSKFRMMPPDVEPHGRAKRADSQREGSRTLEAQNRRPLSGGIRRPIDCPLMSGNAMLKIQNPLAISLNAVGEP